MRNQQAGWKIGTSIAMELDVALAAASGYFSPYRATAYFQPVLDALTADWQAERQALMGLASSFTSTLTTAAERAGVLFESDYSRATLSIRELTLEAALERLSAECASIGLKPDLALSPAERLAELVAREGAYLLSELGIEATVETPIARRLHHDALRTTQVLRDGPLHSRFWHWLDHFYYQAYGPWRQARQPVIDELEKHALSLLGAVEQTGLPPSTEWLSEQNPLRRFQGLGEAAHLGRKKVFFWLEPFGLFDSWSVTPEWITVSFAEPGVLYQSYRQHVEDLARRVQALADPTRLVILRLIRHFSWMNTEMATFLGLARPTISIHAKILREAGLIRSHNEGRQVRHELAPEEVRRLFHELERFLDLPPE